MYLPDRKNATIIRFAQSGRGAARLARLHGVQEVGGSNPLAPTAYEPSFHQDGFILSIHGDRPMNTDQENRPSSINTKSILSLVFGILTLLSFCTGWMPIPFTGFICFPTSFLLGIFALVFGTTSLRQIQQRNESGHPMAWTGIIIGGFVFLCVLCMIITIGVLLVYSPNTIHMPPFLQNPQI